MSNATNLDSSINEILNAEENDDEDGEFPMEFTPEIDEKNDLYTFLNVSRNVSVLNL